MSASVQSRRDFLTGAAAAAGLCAGFSLKNAFGRSRADRPNIIIILADDLGYGDVSGFGCRKSPYPTPNIETMAAEGAKLTDFYVPTPYCAPSRATLLTGRYPFRNGVVFNPAPDSGINEVGLPPGEITIAEELKSAGYGTCCIGKWHLGHVPEFMPRRQGFDEYFGILYSNDMRPVQLVENEEVAEYPVVQATLTKRYTERSIDFIKRNCRKDKPFFLYLPHAMPHKPLAASEDFYTPDTPEDLYADVIRELDWSVGRILETLKELKIDENTLVLFLSDNGPWYGGSTGGLRGMKAMTWEGGLRVPFIARWPGVIPAGVVSGEVAASVDIFPTILKAAGVDIPRERKLDGLDIMPLLRFEGARSPHEAVFAMQGTRLRIVRSGKWKLHVLSPGSIPNRGDDWIDPRGPDGVTLLAPYEQARPSEYPGVKGGDGPGEMMLFNLETDPSEQHNVAADHPEVVKRLKEMYDRMLKDVPEFKPPERFKSLRRLRGGKLKYDRY